MGTLLRGICSLFTPSNLPRVRNDWIKQLNFFQRANSIICPGNGSSGESNNSLLELLRPYGLVEETKEINTLSPGSPVQLLQREMCTRCISCSWAGTQCQGLTKLSPLPCWTSLSAHNVVREWEKSNTANSVWSSLTRVTGDGVNSIADVRSVSDV